MENNDYISRKALKAEFESMECIDHNQKKTTVAFGNGVRWMLNDVIPKEIDKAPPINVAPVVYGKWETTSDNAYFVECSLCKKGKHTILGETEWNWCPNCGAKMMEAKDDESL